MDWITAKTREAGGCSFVRNGGRNNPSLYQVESVDYRKVAAVAGCRASWILLGGRVVRAPHPCGVQPVTQFAPFGGWAAEFAQ